MKKPYPNRIACGDAVQHLLRGVRARQCRAPTGVPHVNENRYIGL